MVMSEDDVRAQLSTPLASPAFPRGLMKGLGTAPTEDDE